MQSMAQHEGAGMTELKTRVKVLIPATIREILGSGQATVETAGANHIVEYLSNLEALPEVPPLESIEKRVERLARVMCESDAIDSEARASIGQPYLTRGGFIMTGTPFEAWRLYVGYARALIDKGLA